MKIESYKYPKSSFLSIDKDVNTLIDKMMANETLLRLLYYTSDQPLEINEKQPKLIDESNDEQMDDLWKKMLGDKNLYGKKYIRTVPKITVDAEVMNYIVIAFDNFIPNPKNPHFRDNIISFDIICHFDQWQMTGRYAGLRPYRIVGELDAMFNESRLSGIGTLNFLGANQLILNDEFGGYTLLYTAVHGDDDTNPHVVRYDEDLMGGGGNSPTEDLSILNFNDMFNKKK